MASITSFLVRPDLIIVVTITIFFATMFVFTSHADRKDELCIPAERGYNKYAWSKTRLPDGTWGNVQVGVLLYIQSQLRWAQKEGGKDTCDAKTFETGDGNGNDGGQPDITEVFAFAGCEKGLEDEECRNCVGNMTVDIRRNYPDAAGAQGVTAYCCVRYETYKFC